MKGGRSWNDARHGAFQTARRRWPAIELTFDQFSGHLDRLGWGAELPRQVDSVYLCAACSAGSNAACESLDREYFPALSGAIGRRYRHRDFAEEVLQQTRERLFVGRAPRIATYRGDGSLAGWLRQVAHHLALDLRRRQRAHRLVDWQHQAALASSEACEGPPLNAAPSIFWTRRLQQSLTASIIALDASHRQLLQLFYLQRINVEELARCFGIDRATAYRRLRRAERLVRDGVIKAVRVETRHLHSEELDELLRQSCCDLHVDDVWGADAMR